VTSKGKEWLAAVWLTLLKDGPSGDLDSDLRVFLIALRAGKDRARAETFLRSGIEHRQEAIAEVEGKVREEGSISLADDYVGLRRKATAVILKAEVKAIDSILDSLRDGRPIGKRGKAS
jgi:hypothetical protein